jgi:hypothetical protein
VDQIHLWGVTTFRRYVIRHLEAWHRVSRLVWTEDASILRFTLGKDFVVFEMPQWVQNFGDDFKNAMNQKAGKLLTKICLEEQPGEPFVRCLVGRCGTENYPGYALFSPEEHLRHYAKVHNGVINDSAVAVFNEYHRQVALDTLKDFEASHSREKRKRALDRFASNSTSKWAKRSV